MSASGAQSLRDRVLDLRRALQLRNRVLGPLSRVRDARQRRDLRARKGDEVLRFDALRPEFRTTFERLSQYEAPAFTSSAWTGFDQRLARTLLPAPPRDFLSHPLVHLTLFFTGPRQIVRAELEHLQRAAPAGMLSTLLEESPVGDPPLLRGPYATSPNTVHHAFHLVRFSAAVQVAWEALGSVVEWGGGYGNQALMLRRLAGEQLTYVIVDLPLLSAVQWIYLSSVLGGDAVTVLTDGGQPEAGKINLLPVGLLDGVDLDADLFLSTFALSESSQAAQEHVAARDWFGAQHLLLGYQDSSYQFPTASRIGALAEQAGARTEPLGIIAGATYAFR